MALNILEIIFITLVLVAGTLVVCGSLVMVLIWLLIKAIDRALWLKEHIDELNRLKPKRHPFNQRPF